MTLVAYPEGPPAPTVKIGDPRWAQVTHALPLVLPKPLRQPSDCKIGGFTRLTLRNGKVIDYGPCARPVSIEGIRCVIAGCPAPAAAALAERLCRSAMPSGVHLVSSEATTIQAFRSTTIATIGPAQVHRFEPLPASTYGAWCWSGQPGSYSVYEVASDGEVQQVVGGMNGVSPADAHGPPIVP